MLSQDRSEQLGKTAEAIESPHASLDPLAAEFGRASAAKFREFEGAQKARESDQPVLVFDQSLISVTVSIRSIGLEPASTGFDRRPACMMPVAVALVGY